jgi:hypothetical protein
MHNQAYEYTGTVDNGTYIIDFASIGFGLNEVSSSTVRVLKNDVI